MPGTVDNKAIYSLRVLIPFWVLQLLNVILLLAFAALWLQFIIGLYSFIYCYDYSSYYDGEPYCTSYYSDDTAAPLGVSAAAAGLAVALAAIFLILHITQIALFGRKKLTPAANFGFELSRLIVLLIEIGLVGAAGGLGFIDYAVLPLVCVLWFLYLGTLIYASVLYHRYRRSRYEGGGYGYGYGYHPHAYGHAPYQQGPYQQGPHQQAPYQQAHLQQGQYPQGPYQQSPHPQGQYQAYSPQHGIPPQGQQMQNLNQPHDISRHVQPNNYQATSPQNGIHGQHDVSPIQPHSVPVSTSSPPPQELKSGR